MSAKVVFKKQADGAYYVYKGGKLFGMVSEMDEFEKKRYGKKYRLWYADNDAFIGYPAHWMASNLKDAKFCMGVLAE